MPNQPIGMGFVGPSNTLSNTQGLIEVFMSRSPTSTDINYPIGKRWFDTSENKEYILKGFSSSFDVSLNQTVLQANWITGIDISNALEKFTAGANIAGSFPVLPNYFNRIAIGSSSNTIQVTGTPNALNFNSVIQYISTDLISFTFPQNSGLHDFTFLTLPVGTWIVFCYARMADTNAYISTQSKTISDNRLFYSNEIFSSIFPLIITSDGTKNVYCVYQAPPGPYEASVKLQAVKIGQ